MFQKSKRTSPLNQGWEPSAHCPYIYIPDMTFIDEFMGTGLVPSAWKLELQAGLQVLVLVHIPCLAGCISLYPLQVEYSSIPITSEAANLVVLHTGCHYRTDLVGQIMGDACLGRCIVLLYQRRKGSVMSSYSFFLSFFFFLGSPTSSACFVGDTNKPIIFESRANQMTSRRRKFGNSVLVSWRFCGVWVNGDLLSFPPINPIKRFHWVDCDRRRAVDSVIHAATVCLGGE